MGLNAWHGERASEGGGGGREEEGRRREEGEREEEINAVREESCEQGKGHAEEPRLGLMDMRGKNVVGGVGIKRVESGWCGIPRGRNMQ